MQICYQCVSALVSWHDLFELCEEVNEKFICCTTKSKDKWKNSDLTCKKASSSEAEKQVIHKEKVTSNAKKDTDSNLIFDVKMEDSNVMLVSLDNVVSAVRLIIMYYNLERVVLEHLLIYV